MPTGRKPNEETELKKETEEKEETEVKEETEEKWVKPKKPEKPTLKPAQDLVDQWLLLMAYAVKNTILEKNMPEYLVEPIRPYNVVLKVYCLRLYKLCYRAQEEAYFEIYDWFEYYFENLHILRYEAYRRARKERYKDTWVVIPEINTPEFYVMYAIAKRFVYGPKQKLSHIHEAEEMTESMDFTLSVHSAKFEESEIIRNPTPPPQKRHKCVIL